MNVLNLRHMKICMQVRRFIVFLDWLRQVLVGLRVTSNNLIKEKEFLSGVRENLRCTFYAPNNSWSKHTWKGCHSVLFRKTIRKWEIIEIKIERCQSSALLILNFSLSLFLKTRTLVHLFLFLLFKPQNSHGDTVSLSFWFDRFFFLSWIKAFQIKNFWSMICIDWSQSDFC